MKRKPLTQQPLFGLLFIVPVGLVAGELAVSARKHYLKANAARLRRSRALKHAQRQLKRARRSKKVQIETGRIVLVYLEDQIQTPLIGLSHSTLAQLLQQRHLSPALIDRVIAALFVRRSKRVQSGQAANEQTMSSRAPDACWKIWKRS